MATFGLPRDPQEATRVSQGLHSMAMGDLHGALRRPAGEDDGTSFSSDHGDGGPFGEGRTMFVHNGFPYIFDKERLVEAGLLFWRCEQHRCCKIFVILVQKHSRDGPVIYALLSKKQIFTSTCLFTPLKVYSVLVTGSDQGIGLGLVKRFLTLPYPPKWIFATTLDLEGDDSKEVKELACGYQNLVLLQLDVTDLKSIQAAVKQVEKCVGEDGLTLLINNAGIWFFNSLEKENAQDMMVAYSVNTIGPLQMSQAFLPLLKKAAQRSPLQGLSCSKAAVINISSSAGSVEVALLWDKGLCLCYRCSKAALNMLTKCQSLEYSKDGILCICIHPGLVKTRYNPYPEITVEESTQGIVTVLSKLSEENNGTFVDWLGQQVPW